MEMLELQANCTDETRQIYKETIERLYKGIAITKECIKKLDSKNKGGLIDDK